MNIVVAGILDVDAVWPIIADGIRKSCERSFDSIPAGALFQLCRCGQAFLILAKDGEDIKGASIWQFRQADQKTVFQSLALTGRDFGEWMPAMRETIRAVAKNGGAVSLLDYGRPGMKKLFEQNGAKPKIAFVAYEEML